MLVAPMLEHRLAIAEPGDLELGVDAGDPQPEAPGRREVDGASVRGPGADVDDEELRRARRRALVRARSCVILAARRPAGLRRGEGGAEKQTGQMSSHESSPGNELANRAARAPRLRDSRKVPGARCSTMPTRHARQRMRRGRDLYSGVCTGSRGRRHGPRRIAVARPPAASSRIAVGYGAISTSAARLPAVAEGERSSPLSPVRQRPDRGGDVTRNRGWPDSVREMSIDVVVSGTMRALMRIDSKKIAQVIGRARADVTETHGQGDVVERPADGCWPSGDFEQSIALRGTRRQH